MAALQLPGESRVLIEPQRPTAGLWMMDNERIHGRVEGLGIGWKKRGNWWEEMGGRGVSITSAQQWDLAQLRKHSLLRLTQLIWVNETTQG